LRGLDAAGSIPFVAAPPILDVAARDAVEAFRFKLLADLGADIETVLVKGIGAFAGGNRPWVSSPSCRSSAVSRDTSKPSLR
jgi:hypothetical protein